MKRNRARIRQKRRLSALARRRKMTEAFRILDGSIEPGAMSIWEKNAVNLHISQRPKSEILPNQI
jgi:hypothetical protein